MKNRIYINLLILTFLMPVFSFAQTLKGDGNIVKKDIAVSGFNKINSLGSFNVFISQSETEKLTVEGDDNLMQYFSAEVSGKELNLSFTKGSISPTKFDVYVTVKELNKLSGVGSGDVKSLNTIKSDKFKLEHVGSGNLDFSVSSTDLKVEITGSGDSKVTADATNCSVEHTGSGNMVFNFDNPKGNVKAEHTGSGDMTAKINSLNAMIDNNGSGNLTAEGTATNLKLENNGTGKFKGESFTAGSLKVELNGSGDVKLNCTKEAVVEINGSGDLYLAGDYTIKKIESNGSGKLIK